MPRGDGTGPMGAGPMTGRGAGYCTGNNVPGFSSGGAFAGRGFGGYGRRYGRGFGFGHGYGFGYGYGRRVEPADTTGEKNFLENRISIMKEALKSLEDRLSELNNQKEN